MSRNLTPILMAVLVLNAIAVGSTMLTNASATTATDPAPHATTTTASAPVAATADFTYIFSTVTAAPYRIVTPAAAAAVDFDKVFASVSAPHRMNTPPNRERLRNIGWRRILGS
jgi:hypothetical protein